MPQKDDTMLRELIDKYAKVFMKLAARRGVPYDDVEDIVTDAFMAFYKSKSYEEVAGNLDEARFAVCRIVINKCVDYARKNSHMLMVDVGEHVGELKGSRSVEPEREVIAKENVARIRECLLGMKEIWRDIAWMYFIEERSISEISRRLEITETVCRSRISRARKYLREELKDLLR
ncbi:MAG: sigma-70 family RNA polymerase sigma factor [Lachnospiraceae bacterium]|nr:sigma-70 family RNA polymerase sigma factor [Lachnospiraceae bacterium]